MVVVAVAVVASAGKSSPFTFKRFSLPRLSAPLAALTGGFLLPPFRG